MSTDVRNDLQSTQDSYRKKLQETREEEDAELVRLKDKHNKAMMQERDSGEATVSHIREGNHDKAESLRAEGENKVTYERNTYDKRVQEAKRQKEEEITQLHKSLASAEKDLERQEKQIESTEAKTSAHEQAATHEIVHREEAQRASAMQKNQEDLDRARDQVAIIKEKIQKANDQEIHKINKQYTQQVDAMKKEHADAYERVKEQDDAQLGAERQKVSGELDNTQKGLVTREVEMREKAQVVDQQEVLQGEARLNKLKKQNQESFDKERTRGSKSNQDVHQYYAQQVDQIHKDGEEQIGVQKTLNTQQLTQQDEQAKMEREKHTKQYEADRKKAFEVYRNQLQHDDGFYRKSLKQQKDEFDRVYASDHDQNEQLLIESKKQLTNELLKEKQQVTQSLGKFNGKSDDPFYQMRSIDYSLNDSGDFYELRAKIPDAERANVKVILKEDKIILQGQRRYEDHVDATDHKLSTESYQSFRNEIPLAHPVQERYATREWKDGIFTLKVPKA